jgi:metallophosphoesterase superfamily enzyme
MSNTKLYRPTIIGQVKDAYKHITKKANRTLVIGDLHEPFCLDSYLQFCIDTYRQHNCNRVIFIGDVIDNHYSSYHEQDPDGMSAGKELEHAIKRLNRWYQAFPEAEVLIGNHDRIIARKAFSAGLSKRWLRELNDVLEVPGWTFAERFVHDNVQYIHGESGRASKKAKDDMMSTVQGHRHTEMFVEFIVGATYKVFGAAVGCGVDIASYAMAYGRNFKKPAIGCLVVFEGKYAINIPMEL